MKCGYVSIVGRPNVGKSSLLNSILERKIAIVTKVSGTTRNIIQGIYTDDDSQIIFIDTPGIHKAKDKLGTYMNRKAYAMEEQSDLVLFLIDASQKFGKGDRFILNKLKERDKEIILIINKIDLVKKESLLSMIDDLSKEHDFAEIFPVSSIKGDNIERLIDTIKKYLPDADAIYDEATLTNITRDFALAEMLREKLMKHTKEEVPHAITCIVEHFEEFEETIDINILIVVDRENLKKIIIGKKGEMLKKVGTEARADMEEMLGKKVFLQTHVKTVDKWRDSDKFILEHGLKEN